MISVLRLVSAGLVIALMSGCEDRGFVFVKGGRAVCEIVATGNKTVDADIAFFTNAVARMTGVKLPIVERASGNRNVLQFQIEDRGLMEEDDYSAIFDMNGIAVVTGSDQSCRWALNRMLEEWGVVFCFPCDGGTHWPRTNLLTVAYAPFSGTKAFKLTRDLYAEDCEWERSLSCKHREGEKFFNHNLYAVFPVEKYGKDPWLTEIMPEIKCKREMPKNPFMRWQPCYASEKGVEEAVKNICAFLDKHPSHKTYSLSVNDLEGYCECAGCKAMNNGSFDKCSAFGKQKSHSESYYKWVNRVVRGVRKRHPDIYFGVLAYCGTIDPPSFRLDDHVVPFLCCDTYQSQDEGIFSEREKLFAAWQQKAKSVGIWDYAYGCRYYQVPRVYSSLQAKYFSLKSKFPFLQAFFMEGSSFIGEGPKRYLYAKLIAEPDCDATVELERWYRACCGVTAAADLKSYYELWEAFYSSKDIRETSWYKRGLGAVYMNFDAHDYLYALKRIQLEEATRLMECIVAGANATGDAAQRFRAERLEEFHRLYVARAIAGGCGLARPNGTFVDADQAAGFIRSLPEICVAEKKAEEIAGRIAARRELSPGIDGRVRGHCKTMRENSKNHPNRNFLMTQVLDYIASPEVVDALSWIKSDSVVDRGFASSLASLAQLDVIPNEAYPFGKNPADDFKLWKMLDHGIAVEDCGIAENGSLRVALVNVKGGWPAAIKVLPRLKPDSDYVYRGRIKNLSKVAVSARMIFALAWPETWAASGKDVDKIVVVQPGETKPFALFGHSAMLVQQGRRSVPAARLYLILNGLPKGGRVEVDSLEVKSLGRN